MNTGEIHSHAMHRTHFMLLVAVVCPNRVLSSKMETYVEFGKSLLSTALPKYSFPIDCAREFSLAVDVDTGVEAAATG